MTERKKLTESSTIKELEEQARNCRHHVENIETDHYGVSFARMFAIQEKMVAAIVKLLEERHDHAD